MPDVLAIGAATGEVEISGACLLTLLEPLPAASTEATRYYLNGIFLQSVGGKLVAAATDGFRLFRTAIAAAKFTDDRRTILPRDAAAILHRLVRATRPDMVTLRRSKTLLAVDAPGFQFCTKLVDAMYPDFERVIPSASDNGAVCDRAELRAALSRLAAVATADPLVALSWAAAGELRMCLARQPDCGADAIAAEVKSRARITVPLPQLVRMISEFSDERIRLEAADAGQRPLVIKSRDKLGLIMPSFISDNVKEAAAAVA